MHGAAGTPLEICRPTWVPMKRSLFSYLLTFVSGYVGKWKRHWFVLNDAVLYYFITPQHQNEAPRCIIPLEGINISPIGTTDLSIGLRVRNAGLFGFLDGSIIFIFLISTAVAGQPPFFFRIMCLLSPSIDYRHALLTAVSPSTDECYVVVFFYNL